MATECMLRTKIYLVSDIMLHTKICNVETYVTHEYEILSQFMVNTKKYVWTYVKHESMMFLV